MAPHRAILLLLSLVLVCGSLGWTAAYGLHLRSDSYRRQVEANLADFFDLPCDVGRIRGHTFSSRAFHDVSVWLPDRRDRVFYCKQALWHELTRDRREAHDLELADGVLTLGTDRWNRGDYRQVIASGLSHDFDRLNLDHVSLHQFEINFDRGGFRVRCRETSGAIDMTDPTDGVATLTAYDLNGVRVSEGVRIHARFLPTQAIVVSQIVLALPEIPLATLGASLPAVGDIRSGTFVGRVEYRQAAPSPTVLISGEMKDADLSEWTASFAGGPLNARVTVKVDQARVESGRLARLEGSGRIRDLSLQEFAPWLKRASLAGTADLRVDHLELDSGRLSRLTLSGEAHGLAAEQWLSLLGRGSATGNLHVRINNLELAGDRVRAADIEVKLLPPPGGVGAIERALLFEAAERLVQFTWPTALPKELLPESVEYAECGVRLLVRDNSLRLLGTHGPRGETLLTLKVFGQPFGVVRESGGEYNIGPWVSDILERARRTRPPRWRDWIEQGEEDKK